ADAQSCSFGLDASVRSCNQLVEAAQILQARAGIALSGGNPVAGASSTLGMRIASIPRVSVAARFTGVGLDMPGITGGDFKAVAHSFNCDGAVGVSSVMSLAPPIGVLVSFDCF